MCIRDRSHKMDIFLTGGDAKEFAKILVEHSTKVKKGDKVLISGDSDAAPLIKEVYELCIKKGALAAVRVSLPGLGYTYYKHASKEQLEYFPKLALVESKQTDVFISIGADYNTREFTNVDPKKMTIRSKVMDPISKVRLSKRWVGTDYPTHALAQDAGMSLEEYEDFVFGACSLAPEKIVSKLEKLRDLVNKTKTVQIIGKNTDLKFSIKGMSAKAEYAKHNVPDAEVFTAPEKYSVEGHIEFTYPAIRAGNEVEGIYLEFKKGKIVKATAKSNEKFLKSMIQTDEGSSYLGEFGIGMNPMITKFTKNLLYDEKIGGTIHLAIGMAYPENYVNNKKNGNYSALHWDIVKDFRMEGGEVKFDGKVVMKDGKWLINF